MTDLTQNMVEKSVEIILKNRYMDVATCKEGSPWVAAVFYGVDSKLNFYFVSRRDSRHGSHINRNSKVAVSIWDSRNPPESADGIQIEGDAQIVEENLEHAVKTLFKKRFKETGRRKEYVDNPEKYSGDTDKKIYGVRTNEIFKLSGAFSRSEVRKEEIQDRLSEIQEEKGLPEAHHNRVKNMD